MAKVKKEECFCQGGWMCPDCWTRRDERIHELEKAIKWLHTNHNNGQIADLVDDVYHKLIKELK